MHRSAIARAAENLPLFPLPRVALLPHTLLPLNVFEGRYRALVADAMAGNRLIGVPMLQDGWEDCYAESPPIHPVFGLGRIVRHHGCADGRCEIVVQGLGRVRLVEEHQDGGLYRRAKVTLLDGGQGCTPITPPLRRTLSEMHMSVRQLTEDRPDVRADVERLIAADRDPAEQCDVLAHICVRSPCLRQEYIELEGVEARADFVLGVLTELRLEEGCCRGIDA